MTDDFVNLHNHSDVGSALDGISGPKEYVARAVEIGQKAVALTDHGTLVGSYALQNAADEAGIQAIWGLESYVAPIIDGRKDSRLVKSPVFYGDKSVTGTRSEGGDISGKGAFLHLTLLARSEEGVHNLIRLNSDSWMTGRYRKARADQELLEKYSDGLIFLSGCPSSEISTRLRIGDLEGAERYLDWAIQTFGRENVFLEVMDHGFPASNNIERATKPGLIYLHDRFKIPFVATNDAHYARPDQQKTQEQMLCLQTGTTMNVPSEAQGGSRFAFDGHGYYLRSGDEMRKAIPSEFVGAIENSALIAEMCSGARLSKVNDRRLWIDMSPYLPDSYGKDKAGYLLAEAKKGLKEIRAQHGREYTKADDDRLEYEMGIIKMKGYPDYFAFVKDFTDHMKSTYNLFENPGRGCLVTGTRTWTRERGFVPIEHVLTGEHVRTHTGALRPVVNTFHYDVDEELVRLTSSTGTVLTLTKNHKVWTRRGEDALGGEWGFVEASDLVPGDKVMRYNVDQPLLRWWVNVDDIVDVDVITYKGEVHDLEVDVDHSFQTEFGVVHNSAGGSLVSYALGITLLDPLRHGLLFERFLNPERESPPDIDFDFPDSHVDQVFDYVSEKFGREKVVHIGTIGREKAKNSINDAARILGYPVSVGKKLSPIVGDAHSLSEVNDPVRTAAAEMGATEVVDVAEKLEGIARQYGIHACGVIASSQPVDSMAPLMIAFKDVVGEDGKKHRVENIVSQWEYPQLEDLGFVKFDFLSLANLTVVNDTIALIKRNHGVDIDANEIVQGPMDDPDVYKLLSRGLTMGVFQLEGDGITDLMSSMHPDSIDDIAAVLALYRPGPMGMGSHTSYVRRKLGKEKLDYIHPELEEVLKPILEKTYGLCIYQEQVMQMAQALAGYSLAEADILRRAVGKKKKYILDAQEAGFRERMMANGFSEESFQAVWDVIVPFSDYGFNASHAYGYALTTYITAYLKAKYAPEFMSSLISVASRGSKNKDKVRAALKECAVLNLSVRPPYVSSALSKTSSDGKDIFLGLASVTGCGEAAREKIMGAQPFTDINDFTSKIAGSGGGITKMCLSSLIDSGAFDEFSKNRAAMTFAIDEMVERMASIKKAPASESLFGDVSEVVKPIQLPDVPDFPQLEKLHREKMSLGLYVSGNPLQNATTYLNTVATTTIPELGSHVWEEVTICGIVSSCSHLRSKKGMPYVKITVEDEDSNDVEALLFNDDVDKAAGVAEDDIVKMTAKVRGGRGDDDEISLGIISIETIPVDENGFVVIPLSVSEKKWQEAGDGDDAAAVSTLLKGEIDTEGSDIPMVITICDLQKVRELGLQVSDRNPSEWDRIVRESSRSVRVNGTKSAAAAALVTLGRIGFETWAWRLRDSEKRWEKMS